jgi:hypothetical protein
VNMDGKVVALRFMTCPERSPTCLDRQRLPSLRVSTVAERGSDVKPRDFFAWSLPFGDLAAQRGDPALETAARLATVESLVPLVLDYELSLGRVRATLTSVHAGTGAKPPPAAAQVQAARRGDAG